MKKLITTLLAVSAIGCTIAGVSACGSDDSVSADFRKDYLKELYVGDEVDLEEYIVRIKGTDTKIVVEYEEETFAGSEKKEEVFLGFNTVFYPKEAGEHTLTYTVTKGEATDSESIKITVKEKMPVITFVNDMAQVQLTKKEPVRTINLLNILQGQMFMSLRNTERDPEFVALERADYNPNADKEELVYAENIPLTLGDWSVTFDKAGMYRGKVEVEEESGVGSAYFYILVEKGEISRQYKSKMNEDGVVTIQAGRYGRNAGAWTTDYGYYGLGLYEMGDTLTFEFKGKNMPNVAIFTDVPSGQPIGNGKGMYIQTSNNSEPWSSRVSIASPNRLETGNKSDYAKYDDYDLGKTQDNWAQDYRSSLGNKSPLGYLMLNDESEYRYTIQSKDAGTGMVELTLLLEEKQNGTYVEVGKFVKKAEHRLPATTQTYAIAYSTGSYINKSVSFTYSIDSAGKRLNADRNSDSLEFKLDGADAQGNVAYYGMGQMITKQIFETTFLGKNVPDVALFADTVGGQPTEGNGLFVSLSDTDMKVYTQRKNGTPAWTCSDNTAITTAQLVDDTQYSLQIFHQKLAGQIKLTFVLRQWNESQQAYEQLKAVETSALDFDVTSIANKHAIIYGKTEAISCTASLTTPVVEGATVLKQGTDDFHVATAFTDWSYVATEKMGLNNKLIIKFMGKNIPNLLMLADSNGGQAYGGGKGYLYVAAQSNPSGGANGEHDYRKRFYMSGPNRAVLDASGIFGRNDASGETILSSVGTANGANGEAAAWNNLQDDTDYILTAWVSKGTTLEGLVLHYVLTTDEGTVVFERHTYVADDYAKSLFGSVDDGYHAILYGNRIADITFTYEVAENTDIEENATTLIMGKEDYHTASPMTNWDYVSAGKFAVNEAVVVSFKGKEIPNVMLLSDSNGGQAYGGGKGYVFVASQTGPSTATRLYASGPNRLCVGDNMLGRGAENILTDAPTSLVARESLDPDTRYVLRAWVTKNNLAEGVTLHYALSKEDGTSVKEYSITVTDDYAKSLFATGNESYDVVLYGNAAIDITFTYTRETMPAPTLVKGTQDASVSRGAYTKWDYKATDKLASGDKLVVAFTGQNIPNVVLCADGNSGQAYGGGKGYAFVAANGNTNFAKRFVASGPNRAAIDGSGIFGRNDASGENLIASGGNEACAWGNLDASTDYVLTVSATKSANGVTFSYVLTKADGTSVYSKSVEATDDYAKSLFGNVGDGYHAILYGNALADITFTYQIVKA